MIFFDWSQPYRPEKARNNQLSDDWRLFIAAIANLDAGKDEPFDYADIYSLAATCIREIAKRVKTGKMSFSISEQKSKPYEKLWRNVVKKLEPWEISVLTESLDSLDLPAIYLVSPHAELIAAGKKTMIVKSKDFSSYCEKPLFFCSSGLCFGTLKMKLPRKVAKHKLDELYPLHRITPDEIEEWWKDKNEFYLYDVYDVSPWDQPRHAEIPQGVQTFIKRVKFLDAKKEELAPVNPSGIEIGEEVTLSEIKKYFKSFYRTKPYVSLIGGICNRGKTKGDIDVFINSNSRDIATEFRLIRMFPQEYWYRFRFRYPFQEETHPGKFTNYLDIFNEKIEVIEKPHLVLMSKKGDSSSLDPQNIPQDGKCAKVELFKFCPLLKPLTGRYKMEEYTIGNLINVVNSHWKYSNKIAVQRKFDGIHCRVDHSKEGKVIVFTEEGNPITEKIPTIVSELKEICKGHDVIVTGELESWEKGKHNPRQVTTAIIHSKGVHPKEETLKLNIFDCLFYDSDIHDESYSKRLELLAKIKDSNHIIKAETKVVDNEADLRKEVKHFSSQEGSEGAYLKVVNGFPYVLTGETKENIKFKNSFSWDVEVKSANKIKGANAWSYLCIIRDPKGNPIPVGKSYNTSIGRTETEPLREGDILKVSFVNLNKYETEDGKAWYNMWSPRPLMWRQDKKKPDNTFTADKLVEASHGTVTKKPWPKRYEDAYSIEDADPYLTYPDESKKWKGMVHCHGRGRSVHLDFRAQMSADYATGWTLYIPKGLSKVPANYAEFKRLVDAEILPLVKETMSNPMKKFNCGKKKPEPIEWLSYQGMVQPGHVGATKNEPGFFYIIDSFEVQFGAQKSYFHEYMCDGKIFNGRLVFRLLENRKEWKKTDEGLLTWMMFNALKSPTPYVISARAVKKAWMPPYGASALPHNIRNKIPEKFQYWKIKDASRRREIRDELVKEIKKKLLKLDSIAQGRFKFLKQTWKGQKVVREGPSRIQYYFVLKHGKNYFSLALNASLLASETATGLPFRHSSSLWAAEGEIRPKTKLNPTKATPSKIEVLDQGKATMLIEGDFRKFILKGKELKGVWVAFQQEGSDLWTVQKSELPKPKT